MVDVVKELLAPGSTRKEISDELKQLYQGVPRGQECHVIMRGG